MIPIALKRVRWLLMLIALGVAQAQVAVSQEAPVLLTIDPGNGADPVALTDADLMEMEQVSFATSTLWTPKVQEFSGPSLHSVLERAGATGPFWVKLVAANDYSVVLGPDLIDDSFPIIANRIDGDRFTMRNKGPLWLIYPFDLEPEYKREIHYSASVWQLTGIEMTTPQDGAITESQ